MKGVVNSMTNEKIYRADEICKKLGISSWTLSNWYRYESKQLKSGEITEHYLPIPERIMSEKGKPRVWTAEMLKQLKDYQSKVVVGRLGVYGKYSNPNYFNTRKYKKSIEEKE